MAPFELHASAQTRVKARIAIALPARGAARDVVTKAGKVTDAILTRNRCCGGEARCQGARHSAGRVHASVGKAPGQAASTELSTSEAVVDKNSSVSMRG